MIKSNVSATLRAEAGKVLCDLLDVSFDEESYDYMLNVSFYFSDKTPKPPFLDPFITYLHASINLEIRTTVDEPNRNLS